jgi:hypothetical protein
MQQGFAAALRGTIRRRNKWKGQKTPMKRNPAHIASLLLGMSTAGCSIAAAMFTAPIRVASIPVQGVATGPVVNILLKFGPRFDPSAMTAFSVDKFTFHLSNLCPRPKANVTSAIGAGAYVNGEFQCRAFGFYFWPNAVRGMPHWHRLSVAYECGWFCALPLRPETQGKGFIFEPPYLVLSPDGKTLSSESVSFGTLKFSRVIRRSAIYAERVAVQNPAPARGISVLLSDSSPDTQVCSRDIACGSSAASVTIPGGSKSALFYLSPFPNAKIVGKHHFAIAAVAKGCETGTDGGTILYQP